METPDSSDLTISSNSCQRSTSTAFNKREKSPRPHKRKDQPLLQEAIPSAKRPLRSVETLQGGTIYPQTLEDDLVSWGLQEEGTGMVDMLRISCDRKTTIERRRIIRIDMDHGNELQRDWDNIDRMPDLRKDFQSSRGWAMRETFFMKSSQLYGPRNNLDYKHWLVCMTHDEALGVNRDANGPQQMTSPGKRFYGALFVCEIQDVVYRDPQNKRGYTQLTFVDMPKETLEEQSEIKQILDHAIQHHRTTLNNACQVPWC